MPQLHCYVPKEVAREIRRRAQAEGLTVSALLGRMLQREISTGWPEGYFDDVVGGWQGEPLERPLQPPLEAREEL